MTRAVDAQTLGPILVFGAFAASDAAVRLLDAYPGSALVWYLNFELFYTFEIARLGHSPLELLFGPYGLLGSGAVVVAAILARAAGVRFMVAFLANISFATVLALVHCRLCDLMMRAGSTWSSLPEARPAEMALGLLLVGASVVAFVASHLSFVAVIMRECGEHRPGRALHPAPLIAATC